MQQSTSAFFLITLLSIFLSACGASCVFSKNGQTINKGSGLLSELFLDIGMQVGQDFVVNTKIDLQGKQVSIPAEVTLYIKQGGSIVNGTLIGNNTKLISSIKGSLGVKMKGTWSVEKIKDIVFSQDYLSDTDIINNLNAIQSDRENNEITITRDYTVTISNTGGSALDLKSNTSLILDATLSLAPNNFKSYKIVSIQGRENVFIKGGKIVGDVGTHTYLEGSTSEWGVGVYILESRNVSIENLSIIRCTGDGIYISGGKERTIGLYDHSSKNILIQKVTCDSNRRQGLSIIHVDGISVKDCSFINTGQVEFTAPGAGIDIEPNVRDEQNMSVRNVVIDNCKITNNKGPAVSTSNTYEAEGKLNFDNILFSNCFTDGQLKAQSTGVVYRNCSFKEVRFAAVYAPTHITMESCKISGGYGIVLYAPSGHAERYKDCLLSIDLKDCSISVAAEETETMSLISCYKSYVDNLGHVILNNCRLVIPSAKSESFKLTDYSFKNKLHISASTIIMEGGVFDSSGMMLDNNVIHCKRSIKGPIQSTNRIITDRK